MTRTAGSTYSLSSISLWLVRGRRMTSSFVSFLCWKTREQVLIVTNRFVSNSKPITNSYLPQGQQWFRDLAGTRTDEENSTFRSVYVPAIFQPRDRENAPLTYAFLFHFQLSSRSRHTNDYQVPTITNHVTQNNHPPLNLLLFPPPHNPPSNPPARSNPLAPNQPSLLSSIP
jgi:hypothetical protein